MQLSQFDRGDDVRDLVSLGIVEVHDCGASRAHDALNLEIDQVSQRLRQRWVGKKPSEIPLTRQARALYRSIGIDPTRHRPSSEALLRRTLQGKPFPRIHPAVDLANLWAMSSGLPVGLYDLSKISGDRITLRLGGEGESYEGIRKGTVSLDGKLLLADDAGPFGNPSSDSARTSVDVASDDLLFVMIASATTDVTQLDAWVAWLRERVPSHLGGHALSGVLP